MNTVLWLPGWYPSKVDPFNGDFIHRHALATAAFTPVYLIYVVPCSSDLMHTSPEITQTVNGNLTEVIIYYKKTSNSYLHRIISFFRRNYIYHKIIKAYIRTHGKPRFVHVHEAAWVGGWALWLKRTYAIPYYITAHWTAFNKDVAHSVHNWNVFKKGALKKIFLNSQLILPVSNNLKKSIEDLTGATAVKVIRNVVDTTVFKYMHRPANDCFTFIHVSALGAAKNPHGLLRSFSAFIASGNQAQLKLIGPVSPALKTWVNNHIPSDHLSRIHFVGELPYREVAAHIQLADAFVLFSNYENFPCVIIEALCCGVPVIATNVGGVAEAIHPGNGKLIGTGNETELIATFGWFMQNQNYFNGAAIAAEAQSAYSYETIGSTIASLYE